MRMNSTRKSLRMERLEDRALLAADLLVSLDADGNLEVTAQNDDGALFSIVQSSTDPQEFVLESNSGATFSGDYTTLGNDSQAIVPGVTGDILVSLGTGDDSLRMAGPSIPGDVIVNTGGGHDNVSFIDAPSEVAGDIYVSNPIDGAGFAATDLVVQGSIVVETADNTGVPFFATLILLDSFVGEDVLFSTGAGNFSANFGGVEVGDDVYISGDQGIAHGMVEGLVVGDDLVWLAGDGDSSIEGGGLEVSDNFVLSLGGGANEVALEEVTVLGKLNVSAGEGDDSLELANIVVGESTYFNLGSGENALLVDGMDAGLALTIYGSGVNGIDLFNVSSDYFITIVTCSGNDQIVLVGGQTKSALISTSSGVDGVDLIDSAFERLVVNLGSGDDTLNIGGTTVSRWALLFGGSGEDTLIYDDATDVAFGLAFSFENCIDESAA